MNAVESDNRREATMWTRKLLVLALLSMSTEATAQIRRSPVRRPTEPQAAPLPPEAAPVARALAFRRSRWSAEGYTVFSAVNMPSSSGGSSSSAAYGAGTRADFRVTDHFSATMDMTASLFSGFGSA